MSSDPWKQYDKKGPPAVPETPFYGLLMAGGLLTLMLFKRLRK